MKQMESFSAFGGEALLFLREVTDLEEEGAFGEALEGVPLFRREKALSSKSPLGRALSLGAGLVMMAGFEAFGLDMGNIDLVYGEKGKPYVRDGGFFFNLSHSGTYALGIFSRREVGCDIQKVGKAKDRLSQRFFHPGEVSFLEGLSQEERDRAFYRLWALKESYIKASGEGLSCPLSSFCIDLEGPRVLEGEKTMALEEKSLAGYALGMAMLR